MNTDVFPFFRVAPPQAAEKKSPISCAILEIEAGDPPIS